MRGDAAVTLILPARPPHVLVALGHGAGGGVDAPDLSAVTAALAAAGAAVALVTQPYRVAGRRAPAPAAALDEAWTAVVRALRAGAAGLPPGLPLVCGGRSSGARVACRTAAATGAVGVVALAFPLRPPVRPSRGRKGEPAGAPRPSRAEELRDAAAVAPVLVVQGTSDPFGGPDAVAGEVGDRTGREVVVHPVPGGDHSLRAGRPRRVPEEVPAVVVRAVRGWVSARGIDLAAAGVGGRAGGRPPEDT